jgi:pimeloyl-ACP methyl ester carboxylesterase
MAITTRGSLTISHLDEGSGPTALLLHSGGASSRQWLRLAAKLKPFRRVLAPDLLGYGRTTPWPADAPFDLAEDLRIVDALLEGVPGPYDIVGHSYGGMLALQLARARPRDVRTLAIYEPVAFGVLYEPPDPDGEAELAALNHDGRFLDDDANGGDEVWLERFVDYWSGKGAFRDLSEGTRGAFLAAGRKVFQEVRSIMADRTPAEAYKVIEAPVLLMNGADSPLAAQRVCERLARALPRVRRVTFPETGHMGPLTNATAVNDLIAAHMEEAVAPR